MKGMPPLVYTWGGGEDGRRGGGGGGEEGREEGEGEGEREEGRGRRGEGGGEEEGRRRERGGGEREEGRGGCSVKVRAWEVGVMDRCQTMTHLWDFWLQVISLGQVTAVACYTMDGIIHLWLW